MARVASTRRELPPPLPPESRTVGQLVGEAIRIYGRNVWKALAVGLPVAFVNALVWAAPDSNPIFVAVVGALLATLSYVVACSIVTGQPLRSRRAVVAYCIGVLVFVPFPLLATLFILPGLIWLSLFGLAVPAALVEGLGVRGSLVRAVRLARVGLRPRSRRAWPRSRSSSSSPRHRSSSSSASSQRTRESPRQRSLRSSCRRSCFSAPRSCTSTRPLD